ncbi:MAG: CDP-alcohol phosphatidyltransferase family protein [Candidatus Binatia bacterium]
MTSGGEKTTSTVWILTTPHQQHLRIWGLSPVERIRRTLRAAGVNETQIKSGSVAEITAAGPSIVVLRADYVFDGRLIHALLSATNTILVPAETTEGSSRSSAVAAHVPATRLAEILPLLSNDGQPDARGRLEEVQYVVPTELVPAYSATLRKADPPYLFPLHEDSTVIEERIFAAAYKGITDLVTKWVWPRPARVVVQWCVAAGVTPNMVTVLSWLLVILVTWLFLRGQFGLGLVLAWLMTFLDTVDGKLARVTLSSSRIGHVLDHGLDILHPPFWYLAWAMGLFFTAGIADTATSPLGMEVYAWVRPAAMIAVAGYIVGRLLEGIFLLVFKMEIHCWQPIDAFFRTITARRNPNLLLLTTATLFGRPDVGLLLVALWTLGSIGFHSVRLMQALVQKWQGRPIQVWQEPHRVKAEVSEGTKKEPPHRSESWA